MRRDIVVENDIVIERIPLVPVCQLKLCTGYKRHHLLHRCDQH